jgi:hypothetical protein
MSFLLVFELILTYVLVGALLFVLALAVVINWRTTPPLLDGRPLGSALDEHAHERLTLDRALAEDRAVAALDALWDLPAVEHPPLREWRP